MKNKVKIATALASIGLCLGGAFLFVGCDKNGNDGGNNNTTNEQIKVVYDEAVENGYSGTYEEWLEKIKNNDEKEIIKYEYISNEIGWTMLNEAKYKKDIRVTNNNVIYEHKYELLRQNGEALGSNSVSKFYVDDERYLYYETSDEQIFQFTYQNSSYKYDIKNNNISSVFNGSIYPTIKTSMFDTIRPLIDKSNIQYCKQLENGDIIIKIFCGVETTENDELKITSVFSDITISSEGLIKSEKNFVEITQQSMATPNVYVETVTFNYGDNKKEDFAKYYSDALQLLNNEDNI